MYIRLFHTTTIILLFCFTAQSQVPISQQEDALPVPLFLGQTASPSRIQALDIPNHPYMESNGMSNMHNDPYMSDTYVSGGPLGIAPMKVNSSDLCSETDPFAVCATMAFDSKGRIVTAAIGVNEVRLFLIDPETLVPLATFDLPSKTAGADISASGYFFIDEKDRVIVPARRQIWSLVYDDSSFQYDTIYELENVIPEGDAVASTLPDFDGRLWFATQGGAIGTIDRERDSNGQSVFVKRLDGERIENSFAIDETGGVFIVSDTALYRFDAGSNGEPTIAWRETYDRGSQIKPGQFCQGSGTTPTLMGSQYIAITDNAEPQMHVLVYRREKDLDGPRLVCSIPVFSPNRSATENSLIATDRSIIVENNYGYSNFTATIDGHTTEPGMTRIDLEDNGDYRVVWTSQESVPSVVSKLSLANGLIYTYTKNEGPESTDAWYFTAIDFETGRTVFKQLAGTGFGFNNHYAGIYLGSNGTAYAGVMRGIVSIRDKEEIESGFLNWEEIDK